jgi:hypothetical protein
MLHLRPRSSQSLCKPFTDTTKYVKSKKKGPLTLLAGGGAASSCSSSPSSSSGSGLGSLRGRPRPRFTGAASASAFLAPPAGSERDKCRRNVQEWPISMVGRGEAGAPTATLDGGSLCLCLLGTSCWE